VAEVEDELVGSGGISIYEVPPGKRAEAAGGYVMSGTSCLRIVGVESRWRSSTA